MKCIFTTLIFFITLLFSNESIACDTSPVLTASNVVDIGGGFFTFDFQMCIGSTGSQDGFNVTVGCGLNITATSAATLTNSGKVATGSISGGVLTYTWPGYPPTWWEVNDGISGPCFNMTLTVNGDPSGCSVTCTGINDGCGFISTSWSTTIPGPCLVDYVVGSPASQSGTTVGAGNNCPVRASQDIVVQVNVACNDTYTFSLCGGSAWDTYLYLSSACCGSTLASNDDGCGLQSTITSALAAGTYFVTIEAYSAGTTGPFTLNVTQAGPPCPLPVELIYFDGKHNPDRGVNELTWSTLTEENNSHFQLEKSLDGINFMSISTIDGAGNSLEPQHYASEDVSLTSDVAYYRLAQVDFDGKITNSNVISIARDITGIVVFPNPATNSLFVTISEENRVGASIQLLSLSGQVISSQVIADDLSGDVSVEGFSSLVEGAYMVAIMDANNQVVHRDIVMKK